MSRFSKLDKLFREVIMKERPHRCEWCGRKDGTLAISHILSKGAHPRLRYCKNNILLLCFHCHIICWHRNPLAASKWLTEYKGKDYYDHLRTLERILPKTDLKMLEIAFKKELASLKG